MGPTFHRPYESGFNLKGKDLCLERNKVCIQEKLFWAIQETKLEIGRSGESEARIQAQDEYFRS